MERDQLVFSYPLMNQTATLFAYRIRASRVLGPTKIMLNWRINGYVGDGASPAVCFYQNESLLRLQYPIPTVTGLQSETVSIPQILNGIIE
jgi:hypothetical protein